MHKVVPFLREAGVGEDEEHPRRIIFSLVQSNSGDPHYTYSLQVEVPDTAEYQRFMQEVMGEYQTIALPLFGEQVVHFTSLLKTIDLS